jgi:hypothetical protein
MFHHLYKCPMTSFVKLVWTKMMKEIEVTFVNAIVQLSYCVYLQPNSRHTLPDCYNT